MTASVADYNSLIQFPIGTGRVDVDQSPREKESREKRPLGWKKMTFPTPAGVMESGGKNPSFLTSLIRSGSSRNVKIPQLEETKFFLHFACGTGNGNLFVVVVGVGVVLK